MKTRDRLFAQLGFRHISHKPMSFLEFFRPLYMLKYPSVGLINFSWYLGVAMRHIGISNIVPIARGQVCSWSPSAHGLSNVGFLVGCIVGEAFAGKVSDIYNRWRLKRNGGIFIPEMRLHPTIPGLIMMHFGLGLRYLR